MEEPDKLDEIVTVKALWRAIIMAPMQGNVIIIIVIVVIIVIIIIFNRGISTSQRRGELILSGTLKSLGRSWQGDK